MSIVPYISLVKAVAFKFSRIKYQFEFSRLNVALTECPLYFNNQLHQDTFSVFAFVPFFHWCEQKKDKSNRCRLTSSFKKASLKLEYSKHLKYREKVRRQSSSFVFFASWPEKLLLTA